MERTLSRLRPCVFAGVTLALTGCGVGSFLFGSPTSPQAGQPGFVQGFLGGVVADEPLAALAGREVLSSGGNAADAAATVAFALAVSLPSRAGLGAGGACIAYASSVKSVNAGGPDAVVFPAVAPAGGSAAGDRPAALPMMARGIYLLHARYGSRPFEYALSTAEQMAKFGIGAPRALVRDLQIVGPALLADPQARSVFTLDGAPLQEGQNLTQPVLAATLSSLRVAGVGDLYQGALAQRIADISPKIGGTLTVDQLRTALPKLLPPLLIPYRNDIAAFPPPPNDGGLAAAAAFKTLMRNPADLAGANTRAMGVASAWRTGGQTIEGLLNTDIAQTYPLPPLPASTSFAVLDKDGNAVVCALSLNNLFGTGRILPGLGFLTAAAPSPMSAPLLSVGLVWNENIHSFRAAVGGSGQDGAPLAVAAAMMNTLRTQAPMDAMVPEPGRANVIACNRYLPSENRSCGWATDPRDFGVAVGGN